MSADAGSAPPQFPAGPFVTDETRDGRRLDVWTRDIAQAPTRLRDAVSGLSDAQLETKYRDWTIRQIVHHIADSHINSYVRFKLALTEEQPTIKPYDENRWSALSDAQRAGVDSSLQLLEALHVRWAFLLHSLAPEAFDRSFFHPESRETVPLRGALAYYAWHGRHHTAQILWLRKYRLAMSQGASAP